MPRRMARASVFAALVASSLAACSLFVDTSGLGGGSGIGDASSSGDASSDVSTHADTGAVDAAAPCDARFCDDFERADVQGPWDGVNLQNDGVLAIADDGTGNHVLRVTIAPGSVSTSPVAYVYKIPPDTVDTVTYRARVKVSGDSLGGTTLSPSIRVDQSDGTYGFVCLALQQQYTPEGSYLWGYAEHDSFPDGGGGTNGGLDFSVAPALGQWNDYSYETDFVNDKITIRLNGVIVYDDDLYNESPSYAPGSVTLYAGLLYSESGFMDNSAFEMLVDDVSIDYSP